jgi:hypothetical protein
MQRRLARSTRIARYLSQLDSPDRQGEAVPEAKGQPAEREIATRREELQRLSSLNILMMQMKRSRYR